MKIKIRIILFLIALIALIFNINTTYARYAAATTGSLTTDFAGWQIAVNNSDITSASVSSLTFTPVIEANANVAAGKMAPGSSGYFDIGIDSSNVDVSYTYSITLSMPNTNDVTDINITDYAIITQTDINNGNPIVKNTYSSNTITNNNLYNNNVSNFEFEYFIIRVYFTWDDTNGSMNDASDTTIGYAAANNTAIDFQINASISFRQYY